MGLQTGNMQCKVNRKLGKGRRQQAWLRSGRRQHEQKTFRGGKEERKKYKTRVTLLGISQDFSYGFHSVAERKTQSVEIPGMGKT